METIDRALLTFFVNALWQAPLVAVSVWAALRAMRHAPARHSHAICVLGVCATLLLPAMSVRRATVEAPVIAIPLQFDTASGTTAPAARTAAVASVTPAVEAPRTAVSIAAWAFLAFLLARVVVLAIAGWKTVRICRSAEPATTTCAAFDRARSVFGLDGVELRWSTRIAGPVTAGRIVILPHSMAASSEEVLATAIGHEMAHIARRDFAWNLVYELLALPISFHPATVWLRRRVDRTREMACDEMVTARLLESHSYARSILDIASIAVAGRPGYTLGVLDGDILEERIRRLVRPRGSYTRRARALAGAVAAGALICIAGASMIAVSVRAQGPAQPEMRAAADAYNARDFAGAVAHFESAVAADPSNTKARLFLAHTYLRLGPANFEKARALTLETIQRDANSKEAYYTLGFIDWMIVYPRLTKAGPYGGAHIYDWIADDALRTQLRRDLLPLIDEGYRSLAVAFRMDPNWSDAMAYLNLTARLHAAIAQSPEESHRDIAEADEWVHKALAVIKTHPTGRPAADRIDLDAPVPTAIMVMAPPPPPPPPPPGVPRGEKQR